MPAVCTDNTPYEKVGNAEPVSLADEVPFDIPDTWEWAHVGDIFAHNTGKALNASNRSGQLLSYITTSNLYWNRFELASLREMYFTEAEIDKCTATKGDLLVCEGGDFGRAAIWPYDTDIRIQNHIHKLRAFSPVCTEYFYYLLGQFTRNYTQTVKRAADNKRRYAPGWVHSTCLLRGFPKGAAPHLAHDFAEQSVVCYTLCRRCPENTVAAGEGKGI